MKTILLVLAALAIYDASRFMFTVIIRFISAYREEKTKTDLQNKLDSLPLQKRLQIKELMKRAIKLNG